MNMITPVPRTNEFELQSIVEKKPLLEDEELLSENEVTAYNEVSSLIFENYQITCRCSRKVVITAIKVIAVIACYVASYPFIKPAEEVTDIPGLKELFVGGEVIAWGTLSAWSACKIIDRISKKPHVNQKIYHRILYWIPITILGVASEFSDAYVTYKYNKSIFWSVYTPFIYSLFSIQSLDGMVQEIANSDNYLTRFLYRKTNKMAAFRSKKNFSMIIQNCLQEFIKTSNNSLKLSLIKLGSTKISKRNKVDKALLTLLKSGLEHQMHHLKNEPLWLKRGDITVQIVGTGASLTTTGVNGYLVYKGCKLFINNNYLIAFLIVLSVLPSAYLSANINRLTYSAMFRGLNKIEVCKNFKYNLPSRTGYLIALIITCFGLGALSTVMRDTFGIKKWWAILLFVIVVVSSGILTTNSMIEYSDLVIKKVRILKMSIEAKELAEFDDRLNDLIEYFISMPSESVVDILKRLENVNSEEKFLLDQILNDQKINHLIKIVENKINQQTS